jgi:Nucleotidyltransferase domain
MPNTTIEAMYASMTAGALGAPMCRTRVPLRQYVAGEAFTIRPVPGRCGVGGAAVTSTSEVVDELARRLLRLDWVTDLFVGGSLATGDYVPGVSDLDLVALVNRPVDVDRTAILTALHRELDEGVGSGQDLGCVYVDSAELDDLEASHPMWTHGSLVRRSLSRVARAELVLHGYQVFGRPPSDVLPSMSRTDVREAARSELAGYWARAARHPLWWLDPVMPDLGLTSMARGRHAMSTGELLTKTRAIEEANAPDWLIEDMRARRRGENAVSPRLRSALIGWRDTRRTVAHLPSRYP